MTEKVQLPSLGESVESARIVSVLVQEGDTIDAEDPVLEVETDKATLEVPSPRAGKVAKILVGEGDSVSAGQDVLELEAAEGGDGGAGTESAAEDQESDEREAGRDEGAKSREGKAKRSKSGEDDPAQGVGSSGDGESAKGEGRRKGKGKGKRKGKSDAEESAKGKAKPGDERGSTTRRSEDRERATDEAPQADSGRGDGKGAGAERRDRDAEAGRERSKAETEGGGEADADVESRSEPASPDTDRPSAPPTVRHLARNLGVDLNRVAAADASRLGEEDLYRYVRSRLGNESGKDGGGDSGRSEADREPELPDFSNWGEIEREPLSGIRRTTAQTVMRSWRRVPQVTHFDVARVGELEEFRARHADAEGRISLTAVLVKIVSEALQQFPRMNASFDGRADELVLKKYVHIGVAIDTERGLLVPVVRDVHQKGLRDITAELPEVLDKAQRGDVRPDDLAGATFTISNVGSIGGTHFTPLVVWPQVGILGVGRTTTRLIREEGEIVDAQEMPLSLSYDHRVIDGADAARFTRWIVDALVDPLTMLLDA